MVKCNFFKPLHYHPLSVAGIGPGARCLILYPLHLATKVLHKGSYLIVYLYMYYSSLLFRKET